MELTQKQRQTLKDAVYGIDLLLDKNQEDASVWECDCDPLYESDTNAWNHHEGCASFLADHLEVVSRELQAMLDE